MPQSDRRHAADLEGHDAARELVSQAAIIFILFMRLKGPPSSRWIFAGGGFFWLLFLYGLSMTDYATRLAVLIWRDGTDQLYTGVVPGVGE
jgi:hypothetical protein